MKGRKPIFIHYVHDMERARSFYELVFDVSPSFASFDRIETMQALIEENGGKRIELREATSNVPDRVATFRDPEGNGFELRQYVGFSK